MLFSFLLMYFFNDCWQLFFMFFSDLLVPFSNFLNHSLSLLFINSKLNKKQNTLANYCICRFLTILIFSICSFWRLILFMFLCSFNWRTLILFLTLSRLFSTSTRFFTALNPDYCCALDMSASLLKNYRFFFVIILIGINRIKNWYY